MNRYSGCAVIAGSLVGVAALLCACGSKTEQAQLSEYTVSGVVTDDLTGAAIDGAQVIFEADTLEQTDAHSDGKGHYSMLVQVTEGERFGTLHASAHGYQDSTPQTVYFDGTERVVDLRLRAGAKAN